MYLMLFQFTVGKARRCFIPTAF